MDALQEAELIKEQRMIAAAVLNQQNAIGYYR
jgi:hypothetical protein